MSKWHFEQKEQNIKIFRNTRYQMDHNKKLQDAVHLSLETQNVYKEVEIKKAPKPLSEMLIKVTSNGVIKESINIHKEYPDDKIIILNFASAKHPGGMVTKGSSAQEEAICRSSTLWYCLIGSGIVEENYYQFNREYEGKVHTNLYTSRLIYTPNVIIFKDDSIEKRKKDDIDFNTLKEKDWVTVDVISIPAPNIRNYPIGTRMSEEFQNQLYQIYLERITYIVGMANAKRIADDNRDTHLVLGAWGCGVFRNNPQRVAKAFKEVLETYGGVLHFKQIIFPIPITGKDDNNEVFREVLR